MDVDTKKLLRDISCGLDQLTMAVKELVHLMKPSIKDVGYAQHMERERQRLHSPVANSQMEQTGQGWAEPLPEWEEEWIETGKIADSRSDWRKDSQARLSKAAEELNLPYKKCDNWKQVAELIVLETKHRQAASQDPNEEASYLKQAEEQAQRESTRPSTHTKESETGRKRKPLDSSYTRYCSVCEVNRIHKHNTEGVCPDCAALERNARNAKNLEEQQGSGI